MFSRRFWRLIAGPSTILAVGLVAAVIALARDSAPAGRELDWPFRPDYCGGIERLAFSPDGTIVTAAGSTGAIASWDVATGQGRRFDSSAHRAVIDQALGPDGKMLASVLCDDAVQVGDFEDSGNEDGGGKRSLHLHSAAPVSITVVAFSPDGKTLAVGGERGMVTLRDVAGKRNRGTLRAAGATISCLAFSPDGTLLAAGDQAGTLILWDLATGQIKAVSVVGPLPSVDITGTRRPVRCLAFSPDGSEIALVRYFEQRVTLWDVARGAVRATLSGHLHEVSSLAYAPHGSLLVSGAVDGMIKFWDTRAARERNSFQGHTWQISALAFSPDGQCLASADGDSFLRLWELSRMTR